MKSKSLVATLIGMSMLCGTGAWAKSARTAGRAHKRKASVSRSTTDIAAADVQAVPKTKKVKKTRTKKARSKVDLGQED